MAQLPDLGLDPTLEAADRAMEETSARERRHGVRLGPSWAGSPCLRRVWSQFRWVGLEQFDAKSLKRFEDGRMGEDLMAARLRAVPGVELLTLDPETGRQFAVTGCDGHLYGYVDGLIVGLLQAPKTMHVWEHKQTDEKNLRALERVRAKHGEKQALAEWNEGYHVQAQLYMRRLDLKRHYMTVSSPGGRRTVSVRTNLDAAFADRHLIRLQDLVRSDRPPAKLDSKAFECKWCPFRSNCHEGELAERNCRTCLHSTPSIQGGWTCEKHDCALTTEEQRYGCQYHRYIPDLVDGEQVDFDEGGAWIQYELANGETWRDGGP